MTFRTMSDVNSAIEVIVDNHEGKATINYPNIFKKHLMEYALVENIHFKVFAEKTNIGYSTLCAWRKTHEMGLFNQIGMEETTPKLSLRVKKENYVKEANKNKVVKKSSKEGLLNGPILAKLNKQLEELTNKIRVIEEAEAMGFKVSIAK